MLRSNGTNIIDEHDTNDDDVFVSTIGDVGALMSSGEGVVGFMGGGGFEDEEEEEGVVGVKKEVVVGSPVTEESGVFLGEVGGGGGGVRKGRVGKKGKRGCGRKKGIVGGNEGEDEGIMISGVPGGPVRKVTHNSHTKRCRMKVNQRFKELVQVLPKPPGDVEVKHKAQILDYAITVFKSWNFKKACLEAQLALCSAASLNNWVTETVKRANCLQDALSPFFDLICTRGRWKFAEAWFPMQNGKNSVRLASPTLEFGFGHIPQVMSPDDECGRPKIESFLEESKAFRFEPKEGVPGRVVCTMRPEWLPRLDNEDTFVRAPIAMRKDIQVCFAVPIVSCGYIAAVGIFYDTHSREYDPSVIELAHSVANTIGNAFGAYKGIAGRQQEPPARKSS